MEQDQEVKVQEQVEEWVEVVEEEEWVDMEQDLVDTVFVQIVVRGFHISKVFLAIKLLAQIVEQ
jgi:hypothetical protein